MSTKDWRHQNHNLTHFNVLTEATVTTLCLRFKTFSYKRLYVVCKLNDPRTESTLIIQVWTPEPLRSSSKPCWVPWAPSPVWTQWEWDLHWRARWGTARPEPCRCWDESASVEGCRPAEGGADPQRRQKLQRQTDLDKCFTSQHVAYVSVCLCVCVVLFSRSKPAVMSSLM